MITKSITRDSYRRFFLLLLQVLLFFLFLTSRPAAAMETEWISHPVTGQSVEAVKGEFVVAYYGEQGALNAQMNLSVLTELNAQVVNEQEMSRRNIRLIRVASSVLSSQSTMNALARMPGVRLVEPNYIYRLNAVPNDPNLSNQWHLSNNSNADADVDAPAGWDVYTGNDTIVIGIIDTGLDLDHAEFPSSALAFNTGEIAANLIDDDNNGYVDDVLAVDFWDQDTTVDDDHGHGTFVAGMIAPATNNAAGIAGLCWNAKILPIKIFGNTDETTLHRLIAGIYYAADRGVDVINMSLGSTSPSQLLDDALAYAWNNDVVMAASAGNSNNSVRNYPAANPYVIGVGALDSNNNRAGFSNYNASLSDLTRENALVTSYGASVYSTQNGGGYGSGSGTSFSGPIVAGFAALARGYYPSLNNRQVYDLVTACANDIGGSGADLTFGYGSVKLPQLLKTFGGQILDELEVSSAGSFTQGQAFSVTITAKDNGSAVTGFTRCALEVDSGTVSPRWSGEFSNGLWTGNVTINNVGATILTVRYGDVYDTILLTGTQQVGGLSGFEIQTPSIVTTGETIAVSIRAIDSMNNTVTSFAGSVNIFSDDSSPSGTIQTDMLTGFVNGVLSTGFSVKEAGEIRITVANAADPNETGGVTFLARTRIDTMTVPAFDDFESDSWRWDNGTRTPSMITRWERGSPSGFPASGAFSGNTVWATGLDAAYQNDVQIHLYTPLLDLRGCTLPRCEFMYALEAEVDRDGGYVEVSADGGRSWQRLPGRNIARPHLSDWRGYDISEQDTLTLTIFRDESVYRLIRLTLDDYAGSVVILRMGFLSDDEGAAKRGWVIDDFRLYEKPDTFAVSLVNHQPWSGTTTLRIVGKNEYGETETRFTSRLYLMYGSFGVEPDSTPYFTDGAASFVIGYDSSFTPLVHYGDSEHGTRDAVIRLAPYNQGILVRVEIFGRGGDSLGNALIILSGMGGETVVRTDSQGTVRFLGVSNGSYAVIGRDSGTLGDSVTGLNVLYALSDSSPVVLTLVNGDVNGDGTINDMDQSLVTTYVGQPASNHPEADLNRDEIINTEDVLIQMENFGRR